VSGLRTVAGRARRRLPEPAVSAARALLLGGPIGPSLLGLLAATVISVVSMITLAHRLMHRRILGE
jgi:hypothetical protein